MIRVRSNNDLKWAAAAGVGRGQRVLREQKTQALETEDMAAGRAHQWVSLLHSLWKQTVGLNKDLYF